MSFPAVLDSRFFDASLGYLRNMNMASVRMSLASSYFLFYACGAYFGGTSISSRYSSILLTSVRTSPWKVRKGGCVPGAKLWRSAGFLSGVESFYYLYYWTAMKCHCVFFVLILVNKQCSFVCLLLLLVPTTLGPHFHSIYCFVHYPHVLL